MHHDEFEHSKLDTRAIHAGRHPDPEFGAVATPIYQTSTFAFTSAAQGAARFAGQEAGYIYTRMGNPTTASLEQSIAALEGGYGGLATASGMAAACTLYMTFLGQGAHLVGTEAVYGPSRVVVERDFARFGVESSWVDTTDLDAVERAIRPNTKMLFIETPANPTIAITDLAGCAAIAEKHDLVMVVDNTFASPILQRPLELGAHVVMHSVTKFINGHTDVVGGMIVCDTEERFKQVQKVLFYQGGTMDPHQAWLVLRGAQTLALRVRAAQRNAQAVAEMLELHPKVEWVRYPGLASHPQYALGKKQMDGPGSLISFSLKGGHDAGATLMESVRVAILAVSLGGIESLIQHPASMTHAAMSREDREASGISDGLVRLSVGCEDIGDLLEDMAQALDRCPA